MSGPAGAEVTEVTRLRLAAGADPAAASLPDRPRRAVTLATAVGAPVLDALDGAASAEADARRARRAIDVACAQSRAVAVGLLLAPLLLVPGLGRLLDVDLLDFYAQPMGWLVAGAVVVLLGLGAATVLALLRRVRSPLARRGSPWPAVAAALLVGWLVTWWLAPLAGWLAARARRPSEEPAEVDEVADLLATALAGGSSPSRAVREVATVRADLAEPLGRLAFDLDLGVADGDHPPPLDRVAVLLTTAVEVGAPVGDALRRLAVDLRAEDLARALAAAERLPAQLTFPTALCLLPAVLLSIGTPIVHAGLTAAGT